METMTIGEQFYEMESRRVKTLLRDNPYGDGSRMNRDYIGKVRKVLYWNQHLGLTNYQLWQLRQSVLSNRAEFLLRSPNHSTYNTNKIGEIKMETNIPCEQCGDEVAPDDAIIISDNAYCDDCVRVCDSCEESCVSAEMREDDNIAVCNDCYDDHFITCEDCGAITHNDDFVDVQDSYYCSSCVDNGSFHYCSDADATVHGYEEDCRDCNSGSDEYLHNYSYKPDPLFHDHRNIITRSPLNNVRYFGVELETTPTRGNYRNDAAEYIGENISDDILYMKEDSSISSGFEIVTHPMTLQWARSFFPWEMLNEIEQRNMRAWNDSHCGLHIHINRTAFRSHSHLAKFLLMVYRNEDEMVLFTGRRSDDYAGYDSNERLRFVSRAKGDSVGRRHCAVNLQNDHTIELRVFRPSLKATTVQAYIEFCDALVEYAGTITVEDCVKRNALTFLAFTDWLTTQTKEDYSILHARISKRVYQIA